MLRYLEKQDFDRYVDFAYILATDMTRSGYPTYADGIKTKDDFVDRALTALSNDNEGILLFEREGEVSGWIHYYHLPEDKYLDTCAFCVAEGMNEALSEFVSFARGSFPGSEMYLGFPTENTEAVKVLDAYGFERIEESYNNVLTFSQYTPQPVNAEIIPVTRDNFRLFSDIHSGREDGMYWTSERILDAIDSWRIFVCLQQGETVGAVYYSESDSMSEIFGVDFLDSAYDSEVYRALLTAALNDGKSRGAKYMVFFSDERGRSDALACGFRCVGEYVCFKTTL